MLVIKLILRRYYWLELFHYLSNWELKNFLTWLVNKGELTRRNLWHLLKGWWGVNITWLIINVKFCGIHSSVFYCRLLCYTRCEHQQLTLDLEQEENPIMLPIIRNAPWSLPHHHSALARDTSWPHSHSLLNLLSLHSFTYDELHDAGEVRRLTALMPQPSTGPPLYHSGPSQGLWVLAGLSIFSCLPCDTGQP